MNHVEFVLEGTSENTLVTFKVEGLAIPPLRRPLSVRWSSVEEMTNEHKNYFPESQITITDLRQTEGKELEAELSQDADTKGHSEEVNTLAGDLEIEIEAEDDGGDLKEELSQDADDETCGGLTEDYSQEEINKLAEKQYRRGNEVPR